MSIFATTLPATVAFVARPLLGLGLLAALAVAFRPLLIGLIRAALVTLNPRPSLEQRKALTRLRSILAINRMAKDLDDTHPSLAAELRWLSARA
jgi:hypothetical protein